MTPALIVVGVAAAALAVYLLVRIARQEPDDPWGGWP